MVCMPVSIVPILLLAGLGLDYTLPSTVPDFVKLKMDQFSPYDVTV
jgi:hypothetical protein